MSPKPLVSIIIPFHNRPEKTLRAVKSAQSQIYAEKEIIVVDDGSTADIYKLTKYLNTHKIRLITHEKNKGANAARNTGFSESVGEWVAFLDSDDTWVPSKLSVVIEKLIEHRRFQVAYSGLTQIYSNGTKKTLPVITSNHVYSDLLKKNIIGSASIPVIKSEVFKEMNGFDTELRSAQDWDLWLRIAEKEYMFLPIDQALVNYTIPESPEHISGSFEMFWEGRNQFLQKHRHKYEGQHSTSLSNVYKDIGFILLNKFQNRELSRKCFRMSLISDPGNLKAWKGLTGSLLPGSVYRKITGFTI